MRKGNKPKDNIIVACNMTPVPLNNYRIGLPKKGQLIEVFNSDNKQYFGTGDFQNKPIVSQLKLWHSRKNSVEITIPPLGMIALKYQP